MNNPTEFIPQDGVGSPDALQRLWTPHRMAYIKGESKPNDQTDCPFCRIVDRPDAEVHIVARGSVVYAVLNLYPYNPGHLMVVPYRHVADYTDLTLNEYSEVATFTQIAMRVVRETTNAQGFNIGLNQGSAAGAGITEHLHQHVVPRWGGDTNFMPVISQTKVLPQLLADTRNLLAERWKEVGE